MTINDTRFSRNARNITVFLHALKIEPNTKGELKTQVQLELPEHVDLEFFREAHRLNDEGTLKLYSEFKLLIIESDTGEARRINFTSRGSKTKDYLFVAVLEKYVDPDDRFESLFKRNTYELVLEVAIVTAQGELFASDEDSTGDTAPEPEPTPEGPLEGEEDSTLVAGWTPQQALPTPELLALPSSEIIPEGEFVVLEPELEGGSSPWSDMGRAAPKLSSDETRFTPSQLEAMKKTLRMKLCSHFERTFGWKSDGQTTRVERYLEALSLEQLDALTDRYTHISLTPLAPADFGEKNGRSFKSPRVKEEALQG